jgi:Uncharacterized membrane-associated protein
MLHDFINWILQTVEAWGYLGIFLLMLLESTVLPVPSEAVLIPAGFLAHQGKMDIWLILLAAITGGLVGASINYAFALWVGRPFLERWGRYFFVRPELLQKTDHFFERYGAISTFTGRLVPGIRHLISLPAGLARMHLATFALYTCLGAGLWAVILTLFGYFLGGNQALLREYQHYITAGVIAFVVLVIGGYIWWQKRRP